MSKAKTKIINKEKCDKLMKEITEDRKFYAYIHKVMINTHSDYNVLSKIIELNDFKSECWLKIYKSLDLYDSNKSTLKTFCITCIKSTALMVLRKSKSSKNLLYIWEENMKYCQKTTDRKSFSVFLAYSYRNSGILAHSYIH